MEYSRSFLSFPRSRAEPDLRLRSRLRRSRSRAEINLRSRSRLNRPRRTWQSRSRSNSPRRPPVNAFGRDVREVRDANDRGRTTHVRHTSRFRGETSREVRDVGDVRDQELPSSEKVCAAPQSTEIQTSLGESIPRNGDAGRMPYRSSEVPHRQTNRSDLHSSRKFSGRRGPREEGGYRDLTGNWRRQEKAYTAGGHTLKTRTAPPIESRRVHRPPTKLISDI